MAENLIQIKIQADTSQVLSSIREMTDQMSSRFETVKKSLEPLGEGPDLGKIKASFTQIEQLKQEHNQGMARLDKELAAQNQKSAAAMAQSFNAALDQMLFSSRSFSASLQELWQRLGNAFSGIASRMVSDWITALAAKEDYSILQDLKEITRTAYTAAAHAYKAVVGIPIIGPELAPAAAAVTFAAVEAFGGGINSAAGGWELVPQDQLAMLHKNEMVLPSSLAENVRNMSSGGNSVHVNVGGNTIHTSDPHAFARELDRQFVALVKRHMRKGTFGS